MRAFKFYRYALGIGAAASLLSACGGGSSVPVSTGSTVTGAGGLKNHQTFSYTGNEQTFIVPAGVRRLTVVAHGGKGDGNVSYGYTGLPGRVYAVIPVHPGEKLYVFVGASGTRRRVQRRRRRRRSWIRNVSRDTPAAEHRTFAWVATNSKIALLLPRAAAAPAIALATATPREATGVAWSANREASPRMVAAEAVAAAARRVKPVRAEPAVLALKAAVTANPAATAV